MGIQSVFSLSSMFSADSYHVTSSLCARSVHHRPPAIRELCRAYACVCVCVYDFRSLLTISSIGRVQSAATMREQDYVRTTVVMGRGSEIENVYDL